MYHVRLRKHLFWTLCLPRTAQKIFLNQSRLTFVYPGDKMNRCVAVILMPIEKNRIISCTAKRYVFILPLQCRRNAVLSYSQKSELSNRKIIEPNSKLVLSAQHCVFRYTRDYIYIYRGCFFTLLFARKQGPFQDVERCWRKLSWFVPIQGFFLKSLRLCRQRKTW
jgi:hypothetical protein